MPMALLCTLSLSSSRSRATRIYTLQVPVQRTATHDLGALTHTAHIHALSTPLARPRRHWPFVSRRSTSLSEAWIALTSRCSDAVVASCRSSRSRMPAVDAGWSTAPPPPPPPLAPVPGDGMTSAPVACSCSISSTSRSGRPVSSGMTAAASRRPPRKLPGWASSASIWLARRACVA